MYREKVKIKFVLTIMALAVFGGVNTAASVINQWMQKPIAPQLLVIDQNAGNIKLKLAGYHINYQDYIVLAQSSMNKLEDIVLEAKNNIGPQAKHMFLELASFSKLIFKEAYVYWRQLQGKFFFKDKWKSAILDIA